MALYADLTTWAAVADKLGQDRGLLCRVANGRQKSPPSVSRAVAAYWRERPSKTLEAKYAPVVEWLRAHEVRR